MTNREQAALILLLNQGSVGHDSDLARATIGKSPNLTLGALCRQGLVEWTTPGQTAGAYVLTATGQDVAAELREVN